ncbi:hypothetical protein STRDD11_02141 [Streptococcus sp. DD11]|uniref:hypothetical protein n=1 Tax=Streptococcus sp. DD11 TaxID=1777879 RepID=UPI00079CC0A9|nr:hypothetical protein [Streptococcus sp. DD11]KXT80387.1 hypothetical protein STRDD11_02141 [Streptococcus sp. DD11]
MYFIWACCVYLDDKKIGNKSFCSISDDKEEAVYYIEKTNELTFTELGTTIYFSYSRKDLIQVNNIVYPTYRVD